MSARNVGKDADKLIQFINDEGITLTDWDLAMTFLVRHFMIAAMKAAAKNVDKELFAKECIQQLDDFREDTLSSLEITSKAYATLSKKPSDGETVH